MFKRNVTFQCLESLTLKDIIKRSIKIKPLLFIVMDKLNNLFKYIKHGRQAQVLDPEPAQVQQTWEQAQ